MLKTNTTAPAANLSVPLFGHTEQALRLDRLYTAMAKAGIRTALIRNNANIYYLTGLVFRGYVFIDTESEPLYFVRQPSTLHGLRPDSLHNIRKPEEIPPVLASLGRSTAMPALELDTESYADACRLSAAFCAEAPAQNISPLLRAVRTVKTAAEQQMLIASGDRQSLVYRKIPGLYRPGMSDIELQIEIERASRLEGCLGQFRIAGTEMELFMGNVLTGDNADTPSPYDFAMGGAGLSPSIPVGADGTIIRPGLPVMVDVNGNYTGYMTDMTRCYYTGTLNPEAEKAIGLSRRICAALSEMMVPGAEARALYSRALDMAKEAGMEEYFMGHRSHAGFAGHGIGIEVNELPVIAPRSRSILEAGNVIALEPKFVIPGIGAAGIENTYIVRAEGAPLCITTAPEEAVSLG